jgi:hypothetical protein
MRQEEEEGRKYWSMEWWSGGVVECWSAGVLEWWSAGVLECWSAGVLVRRDGLHRPLRYFLRQ